jgi:hypothetical protein
VSQPPRDPYSVGNCWGPHMNGCPDNAQAMPNEHVDGVLVAHYHCLACAKIYRRKYV